MKKLSLYIILVGFAVAILGIIYLISDKLFLINAKSATAEISNIHTELVIASPHTSFFGYNPKRFADIIFEDYSGKIIIAKVDVPDSIQTNNIQVGILYDPSDPENIKIASIFSLQKDTLIAITGIITLIFGFFLYKRTNRIPNGMYFTK